MSDQIRHVGDDLVFEAGWANGAAPASGLTVILVDIRKPDGTLVGAPITNVDVSANLSNGTVRYTLNGATYNVAAGVYTACFKVTAGTIDSGTAVQWSRIEVEGKLTSARITLLDQLQTLIDRLTSARAGYLDNLNVGGLVASAAGIAAITQAQRVRIGAPGWMERPDSGSVTYRIWLYVYNELHQAEDLDSLPVVTVENNSGTDRSANLSAVVKPASTTGQYYVDYTVSNGHALEQLVIRVAAIEDGVTTRYAEATIVGDDTADPFDLPASGYAPGSLGYALSKIGDGDFDLLSNILQTGDISLIEGDDYTDAVNNALTFTEQSGENWPNITGGSVALVTDIGSFAGSIVTPNTFPRVVKVQLTSEQVATIVERPIRYNLVLSLAAGAGDRTVRSGRVKKQLRPGS